MSSSIQERSAVVSPLLTLIDDVLSRSSCSGLSEEDRSLLTDDLALLALMQRLAFGFMVQEQNESQRLNALFERGC